MSWHAGTSFDPPQSALQSPTQTVASSSIHSPNEEFQTRKRKRSSTLENGNGELLNHENGGSLSPSTTAAKPRHQPGVKRACNDCRQQKLRCNVVAGPDGPYKPCDRCVKHKLQCSIDNDFKRQGKRAAHEEMVRELKLCRSRLAQYEAMGLSLPDQSHMESAVTTGNGHGHSHSLSTTTLGMNEAAASRSLLEMSQGYRGLPSATLPSITAGTTAKTLGEVILSHEELVTLYSMYFSRFHQFLPLLNPDLDYEAYYSMHPLLHWTIVAIAARRYDPKPELLIQIQPGLETMLWTTLSQVPQNYQVCKALALLCNWPFPNSSTSTEPTMMLAGVMFQLAMQYGLHRPSHAQDFSRFRVELRDEDIADRLNTWAAVNIVAQSVATGQGQPPLSRWAWYTYGLHLDSMKPELHTRCQIEKFCDTVTRTVYTMQRDHIVEVDQAQKGLQVDMYARELGELDVTIMSTRVTELKTIENLYLKSAALHLRLAVLFDKPSSPNYKTDLRNLYIAASSFLTAVVDLPEDALLFVPRHIEQMTLAGACTLLRLLDSFYSAHVDVMAGRTLFSRTVEALRRLSIRSNDLPQRLAEVMAQLWQNSSIAQQAYNGGALKQERDETLGLRVRCRSSLSVLYDAIWRWRQQAAQTGRENLDIAVANPTSVATARGTPQPGTDTALAPSTAMGEGYDQELSWDIYQDNNIFDPLSWALDGNLQFGNQMLGVSDGLSFQS